NALGIFEHCNVRCMAGLGCICQRLIDMAEQASLRFVISHPARKKNERRDGVAVDVAPLWSTRHAFHQLEDLPVLVDRLGTSKQPMRVLRSLYCVFERLLPFLCRQPVMGKKPGTCTK